MPADMTVGKMIGSLVSIVVGVALIPVIYGFVTAANITDATIALLVSLLPFFFTLAVLVSTLKPLF